MKQKVTDFYNWLIDMGGYCDKEDMKLKAR